MPTTTIYDTENQYNWASKITNTSDDGTMAYSLVEYDSGVLLFQEYQFGILVRSEFRDAELDGGIHNWTTFITGYDEFGVIEFSGYTYDNGVITAKFYEFGILSHTLTNDAGADVGAPAVGGVYNWNNRGSNYDENGVLTGTGITYDNGVRLSILYEFGALQRTFRSDNNDVMSWTSITNEYDASGELYLTYTENDNGTSKIEKFAFGQRTSILQEDTSQDGATVNWQTIYTEYDDFGMTRKETYFDNDTSRIEEFAFRQRTSILQEDTSQDGSAVNWQAIYTEYDDFGMTRKETYFDNDTSRIEEFAFGQRTSILQEDTSQDGSAVNWQAIYTEYDDFGVTRKETYFDNDTSRIEEFAFGQRTSILQEDTSQDGSAVNWQAIITNFDEIGIKEDRVTFFDDGVVQTENFDENGGRVSITSNDQADAYSWDQQSKNYGADGAISSRETIMDTGDQIIFSFQDDGDRDWRLEIDGDNSHDWLYRVTEFDVNGQNPVITTYDSDAILPTIYADYLETGLL
jgi:uncharacterized protein YbcV (DUF1398 family)